MEAEEARRRRFCGAPPVAGGVGGWERIVMSLWAWPARGGDSSSQHDKTRGRRDEQACASSYWSRVCPQTLSRRPPRLEVVEEALELLRAHDEAGGDLGAVDVGDEDLGVVEALDAVGLDEGWGWGGKGTTLSGEGSRKGLAARAGRGAEATAACGAGGCSGGACAGAAAPREDGGEKEGASGAAHRTGRTRARSASRRPAGPSSSRGGRSSRCGRRRGGAAAWRARRRGALRQLV